MQAQEGAHPDALPPGFAEKSREHRPHHFWQVTFSRVCLKVSARIATRFVDKLKPCDAALNRLKAGEARTSASPTSASPPPSNLSAGSNVWRRKNCVLPMAVDPRGTARTCPACGEDNGRNRETNVFSIACDRKGDADVIGARKHLDQDRCGTWACTVPGAQNVRDSSSRADSHASLGSICIPKDTTTRWQSSCNGRGHGFRQPSWVVQYTA